jgi:hypothetical protein
MIVIPRYVCPVMSEHAKIPVPRAESVKRSIGALIVEKQHEEGDTVQFRQNKRKYTIYCSILSYHVPVDLNICTTFAVYVQFRLTFTHFILFIVMTQKKPTTLITQNNFIAV